MCHYFGGRFRDTHREWIEAEKKMYEFQHIQYVCFKSCCSDVGYQSISLCLCSSKRSLIAQKWKWSIFDCFFFLSFSSVAFFSLSHFVQMLKLKFKRNLKHDMRHKMKLLWQSTEYSTHFSVFFFLVCFVFSCCAWCE